MNQCLPQKRQYVRSIFDIFAPALTVSEIITFKIFDLEKLGPGHEVKRLQCRHLIPNVKFYKSSIACSLS